MFWRNLLDGLPADAKTRLRKCAQPKWVAPMLATLTDEVFRDRDGYLSRNGTGSAASLFAVVAIWISFRGIEFG
jgi:hypothetical protein